LIDRGAHRRRAAILNEAARRIVLLNLAIFSMAASAESVLEQVDAEAAAAVSMAERLWALAELGYQETRSSELLGAYLAESGFSLESGVAGIPTAFVATFGSGRPVIGVLAEFDALPGMSQAAEPSRRPLEPGGAGHACGHHLFGAGAAAAAVSVARWMEANGVPGSIRVYGTPAEEGGSGKVYLTRAGLFDDVDVVLHWHPGSRNDASPATTTANKSGRFTFRGVAAHAAAAPERGRSALDGVESMNYMVNLMREHVPSDSRIHYVITKGGDAPNIVPEIAQVYYYVRHPEAATVIELFERVVAAARGAAMGTETDVDYEVMHGNYAVLPNETLAKRVHAHLLSLGGVSYSPDERRFAEQIQATLGDSLPPLSRAASVEPFQMRQNMGSTDVGDVSWNVPTVGFYAATWVPGTPAHSWQAVAAGGTSIGHKGMLLATRTLALTAADLLRTPSLIAAARAELEERRGQDFRYVALLGERDPPLDYRR
jgi:aminobenzoyl-glutamate utilization protein B